MCKFISIRRKTARSIYYQDYANNSTNKISPKNPPKEAFIQIRKEILDYFFIIE